MIAVQLLAALCCSPALGAGGEIPPASADQLYWEALDSARWRSYTPAPWRTVVLLDRACASGSDKSCSLLRELEANGESWAAVVKSLEAKCSLGEVFACRVIATNACPITDQTDLPQSAACISQMTPFCQSGDHRACAIVSDQLRQTDKRARGLRLATRACDHGDAYGCLARSRFLPMDGKATELEKGCRLGGAEACWESAAVSSIRYSEGRDASFGLEGLSSACRWGMVDACWVLGEALSDAGRPEDAAEARTAVCRENPGYFRSTGEGRADRPSGSPSDEHVLKPSDH